MPDGGIGSLPQRLTQQQGVSRILKCWRNSSGYAANVSRHILTYLIPCHLLTSHTLPTQALLEPYPRLQKLFLPLAQCIKRGDLYAFDQALKQAEDEFVKRRIYLPLERAHDICLRNLLRKVFLAGGFEESKAEGSSGPLVRRTRIPVPEFTAAISLRSKQDIDSDEVECQLANMIYKVRCLFGYFVPQRSLLANMKLA